MNAERAPYFERAEPVLVLSDQLQAIVPRTSHAQKDVGGLSNIRTPSHRDSNP